jgi:hypothetical protein
MGGRPARTQFLRVNSYIGFYLWWRERKVLRTSVAKIVDNKIVARPTWQKRQKDFFSIRALKTQRQTVLFYFLS